MNTQYTDQNYFPWISPIEDRWGDNNRSKGDLLKEEQEERNYSRFGRPEYLTPYIEKAGSILDLRGEVEKPNSISLLCRGKELAEIRVDNKGKAFLGEDFQTPEKRIDPKNLKFPDDYFDLVHARYILLYISEPDKVVAEMIRVLKPGGTILLQDVDCSLGGFPDLRMESVANTIINLFQKEGYDPFVGRKLKSFLKEDGLSDIDLDIDDLDEDSPYWEEGKPKNVFLRTWSTGFEQISKEVPDLLGGKKEVSKMRQSFNEFIEHEDTQNYSHLYTVKGTKPELESSEEPESKSQQKKILGVVLKNLRERKGYTIKEVAKAIGKTPSYVSMLESGTKDNPTLNVLKCYAEVLGTDLLALSLMMQLQDGEKLDSLIARVSQLIQEHRSSALKENR